MIYNAFLTTVQDHLKARLGEGYTVIIQSVPRNNGLVSDGLCIGRTSEAAAPTIYLNSYYDAFKKGMPLPEILDDILKLYEEARLSKNCTFEQFSSFKQMEDKIVYRLVGLSSNQSLLLDLPHIAYLELDLALVFCLYLEDGKGGQLSCLIHNHQKEAWCLTTDDFHRMAHKNTQLLLPANIRPMPEVLHNMALDSMGEEYDPELIDSLIGDCCEPYPLYVLTSKSGLYGACCMMYDDVLKNFADEAGSDLIIMPSSIHEVIFTPDYEGLSYEALDHNVVRINLEDVPLEDRLSNHLYRYSRTEHRITAAFRSDIPLTGQAPARH